MRKLKAALFDLDGTLFDTEVQYSIIWGEIGQIYHPELPDFSQQIKGSTLKQIFENFFPDPQVQKEVIKKLYDFEMKMTYSFYPGALDFLYDLKSHGIKCAIVTSSNVDKMKNVEKVLPTFNQIFDRVLTAEDFTASKPNPDCYLLGARIFGCEIDECVVFEDAMNGLKAGTSSGIFTFGMATTHTREEIVNHCDYVLDSYEGLTYNKIIDIIKNAEN